MMVLMLMIQLLKVIVQVLVVQQPPVRVKQIQIRSLTCGQGTFVTEDLVSKLGVPGVKT